MIKLTDEQLKAVHQITQFCRGQTKEICCSLIGSAGTGKTTVVKTILEELDQANISYCLCAPTHKAALVLQKSTGKTAQTLHHLLALSPTLDIFNLDLNNLLFKASKMCTEIPGHGIVIVDEASMVSDDLFECLLEKCKDRHAKILFIGDAAQLIPVKGQKESKALHSPITCVLSQIHRQQNDNAILPILERLRNTAMLTLPEVSSPCGNIQIFRSRATFVKKVLSLFKEALKQQDTCCIKLGAYTNVVVDAYNEVLHKKLFPDSKAEYNVGEFITIGETIQTATHTLFNSTEYPVSSVKSKPVVIPNIGTFSGYELVLIDQLDNHRIPINVVSVETSEADRLKIAEGIEDIRQAAIKAPKIQRASAWAKYYNTVNSFCAPFALMLSDKRLVKKRSISYGYATTIHKMQGSTYENICIDWQNLNSCIDTTVKRQLQYVAASRTKNNIFVFQ